MKIVLIGFMGTGKSTVGRLLAKRLGWSFFDTDEMVEKQVGSPVPVIIRKQGEPAFRLVEKQAVSLVSLSDRCVIATGGGVPMDDGNMKELEKDSVVVWLKAEPETILKHVKDVSSRPLIDPLDPLTSVRGRLADREKFYKRAAHCLAIDGLSKEQVVEKLMEIALGSPS